MHTSLENVQTMRWHHLMKGCRSTKGKLIVKLETQMALQQEMACDIIQETHRKSSRPSCNLLQKERYGNIVCTEAYLSNCSHIFILFCVIFIC